MTPTKLLYMENMQLLQADVTVIEVLKENDKDVVVLDQTVFYPQGGGQPYDTGVITSETASFKVEQVRFIDGIVKHIGIFEKGTFTPNEIVHCLVEKERRSLHARLHSGGHVIDMAVNELGLQWTPGKGYHFPDGAYVEYSGSLEGVDKEKLKQDLEVIANKFVQEARPTTIQFMSKDEMKTVCKSVPENLPENKPARVVFYGDFGIPCGGTHVSNLSEIKNITVRKIKQSGEHIKVGYDVPRYIIP